MKLSLIISLILVAGALVSCGSDSGTSTSNVNTTPDGVCSAKLVQDRNNIVSERDLYYMKLNYLATQGDSYENFREIVTHYRRIERTCIIFKENHSNIEKCTAEMNYKTVDIVPKDIIVACKETTDEIYPTVTKMIEAYPDLAQI